MNQKRFIILARNKTKPKGNDKTSIVFSFHEDKAGNLFSVLKIFADMKINLTRIESRPAKAEIGKYIFYIDLLGHADELKVKDAIDHIKSITKYFQTLGSYPMHRNSNK